MARYYLNDNADLCGWQLLPYALRYYGNDGTPHYEFIDGKTFETIKLCDGTIDFSLPFFNAEQKQTVLKLVNAGLARELKDGETKTREIQYTYYNNRFVRSALWSVTGRCNSNCRHCYMAAPFAKYGELDKETVFKIADEIAGAGIGSVELTGGECLVRDAFLDIVDYLVKHRIHISRIYSNGYLVDQKLIDGLNRRNVRCGFSFSYDGVGYHDWMRGIPGAQKMTEQAIKLCVQDKRTVDVEMVLFKSNLKSLRETVNRLASLGVVAIKTCPVSDSELWLKNGKGESVSFKEVYDAYLEYIPQYYEDKKPMHLMLGGFFKARSDSNIYSIPAYKNYSCLENACVCGHARNTMYICADGRVSSCMGICDMEITKTFPLIQEIGLKECLTSSSYMQFIDTRAKAIVEHNSKCSECEYKLNCAGGCRAGALQNYPKDRLAIDESTCIIFKDKYIDKIRDVVKTASPESVWGDEL